MLKTEFYKIAIQFCGNAKQNPGCIAVTAIQNLKSIFSLAISRGRDNQSKNMCVNLTTLLTRVLRNIHTPYLQYSDPEYRISTPHNVNT